MSSPSAGFNYEAPTSTDLGNFSQKLLTYGPNQVNYSLRGGNAEPCLSIPDRARLKLGRERSVFRRVGARYFNSRYLYVHRLEELSILKAMT